MARADIHTPSEKETNELVSFGYNSQDTQIIEIVLSERNLLSLLSKLYIEGSAKTIYNGDVPKGYVLKLVSQEDEHHYASETRKGARPGRMVGETEDLISVIKNAIKVWEDERKIVELFNKGVTQAQGA